MADDQGGHQGGHQSLTRFEIREGVRTGESFDVGASRVIVGSDSDCDVTLSDPDVSGEHVSLKTLDGHIEVHDLGSRTGTFVNGARIAAPTLIAPGDELRIGAELLIASPVTGAAPAGAGARLGTRPRRWLLAATVVLLAGAIGLVVALGGGGSKRSAQQVIAHATPSVVRIQGATGAGSGVVFDARRQLVLTNAHVVVGNTAMKAQLGNDRSLTSPVQVIAASPCDDLAVIKLVTPIPSLQALPLGSSSAIRPGDSVTVLGFPGSFQMTPGSPQGGTQQASTVVANTGTVSQTGVQAGPDPSLPTYQNLITHQAPTNHGNSGGPLLNADGQVVGINTLGNFSNQGQYYSIAIDYAKRLLPDLSAGKSHALLGWQLVQLSADDPDLPMTLAGIYESDPSFASDASTLAGDTTRYLRKNPPTTGMYDISDQPGSPADTAGTAGFLILDINDIPVKSLSDVCDVVNSAGPGQTLRIRSYNINSGSDPSQLSAELWAAGRHQGYTTDLKMPSN